MCKVYHLQKNLIMNGLDSNSKKHLFLENGKKIGFLNGMYDFWYND
jgi:hypothetical protein